MGFGRSNAEKQRDVQIQANADAQAQAAQTALQHSNKTFKWFKQTTQPAKDFWTAILSGDRNAVSQLFAPEISAVGSQFDAAMNTNALLTPRGGARASGNTQLLTDKAKAISDILLKARPMAAEQLANLGGLFSGASLGQGGLGANLFSGTNQTLFGLNEQEQRKRDAQAQFWGSLGQGAGQLAGGFLFGKFGGH